MKRKLKAILSVVLCCSLVFTGVLSIGTVSAAASVEYFTEGGKRTGIKLVRTDDGRIYYAVGDGSTLIDAVKNDYEFFEKILTSEYEGISPVKQWANIASALYKDMGNGIGFQTGESDDGFDELYASNDSDGDFILTDVLAEASASTEGAVSSNYMASTGLVHYSSLSELQDAMATEINKVSTNLWDGDNNLIIEAATGKNTGFDYLNNSDNRTVLGTIVTGRTLNGVTSLYGVSSFGLAFYDFQVIPLVEDGVEYVTAAEGYESVKAAAGSGAPNVEYKTLSDGMGYTNYTSNPSHSDSTVSVSFSETSTQSVSNSMESTKSFTFGFGTERSLSVTAAIPGIAEVEGSVSYNFSLSGTIATAYGTETTLTNSTTTSSVADVTLPAHTKIGITQQPSDIEMTFDYDCPVFITYKVAIFGMNGMQTDDILILDTLGGSCTVFGSDVLADGTTATENLYNRAVTKKDVVGFEKTQMFYAHSSSGVDLPESIDWSSVTAASPENGIGTVSSSVEWLNNIIPLSAAGATMSFTAKGMETSITAIEPLYDLYNVRIDGTGTYDLAIGGSLDLGTVITQGYNQYNVPYYGYSTLNGEWSLCDADGNILSTVEGVVLESVSDYQILTAEALGNYYLKYIIHDNIYKSNEGNYLTNSDLASTPVIEISVTKTGQNHICAPGEWKTTIPATCFIEGEQIQCCSVCGLQMNVQKLEKLAHTLMKITTPAACTADGSITEICGICNATISSSAIPATGHDEGVWKIDYEATADHNGQMSRYCTKCGEVLETEEIELHTHEFGYESIIREPTCTANGEKGIFCSICNAMFATEQIEKSGHGATTAVISVQPTCTTDGEEKLYCTDCGMLTGTNIIPAKGHGEDVWIASVAPTCTQAGEEICICTDCEAIIDARAVEAFGHDDGVWKIDFEATVDHNGQMSRYCSKCNEVLESKEFELHTHEFGYESITREPTCTQNGEKSLFCSICGAAYATEQIEKSGHGATVSIIGKEADCTHDGESHQYCTDCGELVGSNIISAHGHAAAWITVKEATCSTVGREENVCTICDAVLETREIAKTEHVPGKWEITKDSTCTQAGLMQQTCAICGALIGEPVVIDAHDHDNGAWRTVLEATCTTDGEKVKECTICEGTIESEIIPALGHDDGVWITALEATCETPGERHKNCTRCGQLIESERIGALGHTPGPEMTCVTDQVCLVCEEVLVPADGKSHVWTDWETYKEASFFVEEQQRRVCTSCDLEEYRFVKGTSGCHKYFPHCDGSGENCWACETLSNTNGFFRNLGKFLTWFFFENIITTILFPFSHGHFHELINLDEIFGS